MILLNISIYRLLWLIDSPELAIISSDHLKSKAVENNSFTQFLNISALRPKNSAKIEFSLSSQVYADIKNICNCKKTNKILINQYLICLSQ